MPHLVHVVLDDDGHAAVHERVRQADAPAMAVGRQAELGVREKLLVFLGTQRLVAALSASRQANGDGQDRTGQGGGQQERTG